MKALKSCLVCLVSYCENHLGPHQTVPGLRKHQLIGPLVNLEGWMCLKHNKTVDLFCKTDQTCVCSICTVSEHKTLLGQECVQKKAELQKEIKEQIDDRHVFISNFNDSIGLSQTNADRKSAGGVNVFISLMDMVEKGMENLVNSIEESHRMAQEVLQLHIKGPEKEISELQKRNTEVQDVSLSGDPLQLSRVSSP